MPKSPRKTPVMKEYQESTSFIIGQGLGILNDDENFHGHHIDSAMEFEDVCILFFTSTCISMYLNIVINVDYIRTLK